MIYITLHRYGKPIVINATHIDWITDFDDYTEIAFQGGDNTLSVDEKGGEVLLLVRKAVSECLEGGK